MTVRSFGCTTRIGSPPTCAALRSRNLPAWRHMTVLFKYGTPREHVKEQTRTGRVAHVSLFFPSVEGSMFGEDRHIVMSYVGQILLHSPVQHCGQQSNKSIVSNTKQHYRRTGGPADGMPKAAHPSWAFVEVFPTGCVGHVSREYATAPNVCNTVAQQATRHPYATECNRYPT